MTPEQNKYLEEFYRAHFHEIMLHAYSVLSNWPDAEEVAQDTFHTASEKIEVFMTHPSPMGWLKNVAKNKALNKWRFNKRRDQGIISMETLSRELAGDGADYDMPSVVSICAEILTPEEFSLFREIEIEGSDMKTAAEQRGITVWACQKRIQRIKKKLQEHWPDK